MKKLNWTEIIYDTYEIIYLMSTPCDSFKRLLKICPTDSENHIEIPFEDFIIPDKVLDQILESQGNKYKLSVSDRGILRRNIYLGASPSDSKNKKRGQ